MSTIPPIPSRVPLSDPRQERIYRRLQLIGPGPAEFFADACQLMTDDRPLQTTTHIVSHLLREIESAMRDVLKTVVQENSSNAADKNKQKAEIISILQSLRIPITDPVAIAWLSVAGRENEQALHARAHRHALDRPIQMDWTYKIFWDDMQNFLDVVLDRFEGSYLRSLEFIDKLILEPSSVKEKVKDLRSHVPNNLVSLGYFFDKLDTPEWIGSLFEAGYFSSPTAPHRDPVKNTILFKPWPQSRYLLRMAKRDPAGVSKIALGVPDTDNMFVQEDFAEIALALPAALAVGLVPRMKTWVENRFNYLLPKKLGSLAASLARAGEVEVALELARVLLELKFDPKNGGQIIAEPNCKFALWIYSQMIREDLPTLVVAAPKKTLTMLCDLLDSLILRLSHLNNESGLDDYSWIWLPSVEEHEQNPYDDPKVMLVLALREATVQAVKDDPKIVAQIGAQLEERKWPIFHRLSLHLLGRFSKENVALISQKLTNRELFDDAAVRKEYSLLAHDCFNLLSAPDKLKILNWIDREPQLERFRLRVESFQGKKLSEQELAIVGKQWQLSRLAPFAQDLPQEWKVRYDEMAEEIGRPQFPEIRTSHFGYFEVRSPKSVEELRTMEVMDLIDFLRQWEPTREPFAQTRDALGNELSDLIGSEPERFVPNAKLFQDLDPTYVRALVNGLRGAIKTKRPFDWFPVLDTLRFVVSQPKDIPNRKSGIRDQDPDWGWTRKSIIDLLIEGFKAETVSTAIPSSLRDSAWKVLGPLTEDPDPTIDEEAKHAGTNRDLVTFSMSSTRGEAIRTVIEYALWVRRIREDALGKEQCRSRGFDEMSEVREVLDFHLDLSRERSLAIRSIYGRLFPWLQYLDPRWASASVGRIFPQEKSIREFRDAAWRSYINFCEPYNEVFEILLGDYSRAIEEIGTTPKKQSAILADEDLRLAEHLMLQYGRGKLPLVDPEGLIPKFYKKASDSLCAHAMVYIGRGLKNETKTFSSEVLDRLKRLWEWRLSVIKADEDPQSHANELISFGWWFASGIFDDSWALEQLTDAFNIARRTNSNHFLIERLAAVAPRMPSEVVRCLFFMIEYDEEDFVAQTWAEQVRKIIESVINSNDKQARESAIDLVHRLGRRGHFRFRDLLPKTSPA